MCMRECACLINYGFGCLCAIALSKIWCRKSHTNRTVSAKFPNAFAHSAVTMTTKKHTSVLSIQITQFMFELCEWHVIGLAGLNFDARLDDARAILRDVIAYRRRFCSRNWRVTTHCIVKKQQTKTILLIQIRIYVRSQQRLDTQFTIQSRFVSFRCTLPRSTSR